MQIANYNQKTFEIHFRLIETSDELSYHFVQNISQKNNQSDKKNKFLLKIGDLSIEMRELFCQLRITFCGMVR